MAKQTAAVGGLDLLVVDYIGLVKSTSKNPNRHEQVAEVSSRGLKALAKELEVPVLALAQINREGAKTKSVPELYHLAESGAIEQDADVVLFLHRQNRDATEAKLVIAAHRHGDTGDIDLQWIPQETRFADASNEWTG